MAHLLWSTFMGRMSIGQQIVRMIAKVMQLPFHVQGEWRMAQRNPGSRRGAMHV